MIDEYHFGTITINKENYNHDVELNNKGKVLSWWRNESHVIDIDAVTRATEQNPNIIIIGTGESGIAKVKEETKEFIEKKGIKLIIEKTKKAVYIFNEQAKNENQKTIGLFHLTC